MIYLLFEGKKRRKQKKKKRIIKHFEMSYWWEWNSLEGRKKRVSWIQNGVSNEKNEISLHGCSIIHPGNPAQAGHDIYNLPTAFDRRFVLCLMVLIHGLPLWISKKENSFFFFQKISPVRNGGKILFFPSFHPPHFF